MSSSSDEEMGSSRGGVNPQMKYPLPETSKGKYLQAYNNFIKWRTEKKLESFSETVFLTYFTDLSKKLRPPSLWSLYSMLKSTIVMKHDVNLKDYNHLRSFLKRQAIGFKSRKSKVFNAKEIETFLKDAPDEIYLATKVALIFGISGGCKTKDLLKLTVEEVEKHDKLVLIRLPKTKNIIDRSFVVREDFAQYVTKYQDLRPVKVHTKRFFLSYQRGKCFKQVIGKNKLGNMPKLIATYLKLPNPELYTGHCFRRTAMYLTK